MLQDSILYLDKFKSGFIEYIYDFHIELLEEWQKKNSRFITAM